jgi:hypothetical protein
MVTYVVWLLIAVRGLGDHRFLTNVITRIIGAYALVSVLKDNEARPVRRTLDWYMRAGDPHHIKTLHEGRQALKSGER